MKRLSIMLLSLLVLFAFTGCNANQQTTPEKKQQNQTTTTKKVTNNPTEPTADDKCYFCDMKIYTKGEKMGTATVQAIKKDGTHVFFDDSGCLLNAERKYKEKYTIQWVRDYVTSDWVKKDKAVVVRANVMTPMKYNYIFFADKASADKYIKENKNAVISSWDAIDQEAAKRYKARMMKMKNGNMNMDSKTSMSEKMK